MGCAQGGSRHWSAALNRPRRNETALVNCPYLPSAARRVPAPRVLPLQVGAWLRKLAPMSRGFETSTAVLRWTETSGPTLGRRVQAEVTAPLRDTSSGRPDSG